ncbi:hypothetical protein DFH09DRAFT_1104337 [Mycena vulgaris]|nr:hypothetical protein DFH09DRAFT_1104337 [Mycena vulgaris]
MSDSLSVSATALRRSRQANVLEMFEDLEHKLEAVAQGSSPISQGIRSKAVRRTEDILRTLGVDPERSKAGVTAPLANSAASDSGPATKKPRLSGAAARQNQAEKRLAEIRHFANEDPLSQQEFMQNIKQPTQGDRRVKENTALGRLVREYSIAGGMRDWRNFVIEFLDDVEPNNIEEEIKAIQQRDGHEQGARMQAYHQAGCHLNVLQHEADSIHAQRLSEYMLRQLSIAAFAIDWKKIQRPGSNKKKQIWRQRDFFTGLDAAESKQAIKGTHKESYKAWRDHQEPIVTARNDFVDVYYAFGPVVFLDPFWDVFSLVSTKRSKEFPLLLKLFLANIPDDPACDAGVSVATFRWTGSCKAVSGVTHAIDGELYECLRGFFVAHPTNVPAQGN